MKPLKILSLGAGVQSSTLLLMSIKGELPKLDACVFADTGWEPSEVYEHYEFLREEAGKSGIPVHRVTGGDLRNHTMKGVMRGKKEDGEQFVSIPLHIRKKDGTTGIVRRQCTRQYKIEPIQKFIKTELLGLSLHARWPLEIVVDLWFGISSDEMRRVRIPDALWKRHVYPLCNIPFDYLKTQFNRQRCVSWLSKHYENRRIPRSACIGCPFKTNREWRYLRSQFPEEWQDAIEVDRSLRGKGDGDTFLHYSSEPLESANLGEDPNQLRFEGFGNECLGYCGN
jgi:hypothetical protein